MSTLASSFSILAQPGVFMYLLRGIAFTCIISVLGVILGLILGSLLALARTYCKKGPARILGWLSAAYIELFRNTPYLLWINKRKSDDPCRWVIAFLVPCGTGRVNDKKVNEENSKVKTKANTEPKKALRSEDVSKFRLCWIQHTTSEQKLQEVF